MARPDFIIADAATLETIQRVGDLQTAQERAAQLAEAGRKVAIYSLVHVATFKKPDLPAS